MYRLFQTEYRAQFLLLLFFAALFSVPDFLVQLQSGQEEIPSWYRILFEKIAVLSGGVLLSRMLYYFGLLKRESFFPALVLFIFSSLPELYISPLLKGGEFMFFALLLFLLLRIYKNESPEDILFFVVFLLALMSLFVPALLFLLPAIWFALLAFNQFTARDFLNTLISFSLPWFFYWAYLHLLDNPKPLIEEFSTHLSLMAWQRLGLKDFLSLLVLLVFTVLPGILKVFSAMYEKVISYRKYSWAMFWFLALSFVMFFFSDDAVRSYFVVILLASGTVYFSMGLSLVRKTFWIDLLFSALCLLLFGYKFYWLYYGIIS